MKNVMVRAWEIAKAAVVKFGGKVKEYFAQALAMAWKEVKNVVETVGFHKYGRKDGNYFFVVNAGVKVSRVYDHRATIMKPFRTGQNKKTGQAIEIYTCGEKEASSFQVVAAAETKSFSFDRKYQVIWA